jgi:hypothetical protein
MDVEQDIDAFIEGANQTDVPEPTPALDRPWTAPSVRSDVQKAFNLRLPEAYLLKLKFIAEHTPRSMQRFSLDVLLPAIDTEIERIMDMRKRLQ